MKTTLFFTLSAGLAVALAAIAQTEKPAAEASKMPTYPRINLAPSYEVVPDWPQRPPEIRWGQMPGVIVDKEDNVWIYTRANPVVQVYSPEGKLLQSWREEDPRTIPHGIKFDSDGNVWLVDVGLEVARKFSREGKLLQTIGTLGESGEDESHFYKPTDIAFGPNGDIFIADGYGNNRIVRYDKTGRFIKAWGKLGTKDGEFSIPHAIAADSKGRLYVADRNNVRVQVFDADGRHLDTWANILVPWSFWITPKDEIWICGSSPMPWTTDPKYPTAPLGCPPKDQLFMKFSPDGKVLQHWTMPKGADDAEKPGELNWLHAIAFDSKGNVYLGDIIGKRLQKFVPKQ
jgi:hypothetical protein